MTGTLKDEITQLKNESVKPKRRTRKKAGDAAASPTLEAVPEDEVEAKEDLEELSRKFSDLVHNAGDEIKAHPVATALGAFALGVVVGAIIRR